MIAFKQDRKKFWRNLVKNILLLNPARAVIVTITLTITVSTLFIDNQLVFNEIHKHFVDKAGRHYYVLHRDTVESDKELEVFEDEDGYYIKAVEWGEGKCIVFIISLLASAMALSSIFVEDLEIEKAVKRTIIDDIKVTRKKDPARHSFGTDYVYTAYSKIVHQSVYNDKDFDGLDGLKMSVRAFMKLQDHLDKEEVRDKKLEEIGIYS